jgi:hypothetical protein
MGANEPAKNNDPPSNQPPSVNPQTVSQTANLPSPGQSSVQVTGAAGKGQDPSLGAAVTVGLPAFSEKNSASLQLGVSNTGYSGQLQGSRYWDRDATSQKSVLVNAQLSMNPKLAAGLGVNFEQDWGGDNAQRPKYQLVEQVYGSGDKNAQIGSVSGTGYTGGVSVLGQRNFGLTNDLNPKYTLGIEVKVQGTRLAEGGVDQFLTTGGAVAAKNWTLNNGSTVVSVGANVYGGVEKHDGSSSVHGVYGGGLTVGVAFGGAPATPAAHEEQKEEPARIVETTVHGIVANVDREHDKLVMDIGSGKTQEFSLSKLRTDAADISADLGRDDEWRKADLVKRAQVLPNGDLKIDNLTVQGDVGHDYKKWLTKPYDKSNQAEHEIIDGIEKGAFDKQPTTLGTGPDDPDFSRGSSKLPKLGVHMAADGKGGERGALAMKGCTFTSIDDKDGVTTVHYKLGGRAMAISMPDTVGGYGKDPANPYNTPSIEAAFKTGLAGQDARDIALTGAKNLVRDLDAKNGPTPLESPNGTTGRDLLKRMTFDEKTLDVHIGNLTLKQDVAAYYLRALSSEGPKDPELIARVERLADSKQPTEIDLAKTRDSAIKARDALGFGEPPNPLKTAFSNLKENEKFDFNIDPKHDAAKLINRTENVETPIHSYGVDPQAPVPPQREHSRQLTHGGPG